MVKLVIAIYEDVAVAQKAVDAVITAGLPQRDVSILSNETIAAIPGAVDSGEPGPLGDAEGFRRGPGFASHGPPP